MIDQVCLVISMLHLCSSTTYAQVDMNCSVYKLLSGSYSNSSIHDKLY